MKRIINFRALNVFQLQADKWEYGYHKHNFYELILIESGRGRQRLNDVVFPYKKGDVFLLTPDDAHEFIIEKPTLFTFIKFTEQVFIEKMAVSKPSNWEESLKLSLMQMPIITESIVRDEKDAMHLFNLAKIMLHEFTGNKLYHYETTLELFTCAMCIVIRNLINHKDGLRTFKNEKEKLSNILSYIRIHAFDNEKIRIEPLADYFLMSANYISIYVKKHTGLSIQQHITQHRIKAAEKLLLQERQNINEIVMKLGFNDASHFNKMFKKYKGVSPLKFRSTHQ